MLVEEREKVQVGLVWSGSGWVSRHGSKTALYDSLLLPRSLKKGGGEGGNETRKTSINLDVKSAHKKLIMQKYSFAYLLKALSLIIKALMVH